MHLMDTKGHCIFIKDYQISKKKPNPFGTQIFKGGSFLEWLIKN